MNLIFNIQTEIINNANASLYFQIDAQGVSFLIIENDVCLALVIYHFEKGISNDNAADCIHQIVADNAILIQTFKNIKVIYGYPVSIMVPSDLYSKNKNKAMLDLLYADIAERIIKVDEIDDKKINNVYGVPTVIDEVIKHYFNTAVCTHLYTSLIHTIKSTGINLYCIFSTGQIKIILFKEDKLQLTQILNYKTPTDVVYQILNICKLFNIEIKDLLINLSGMIDEDSALYRELYKYFLNLYFDELSTKYNYPSEVIEYPSHYFSHLFAITSCV